MANKPRGTLYTGVTSNLPQRAYQHKNHMQNGFSHKYNCTLLVYYACFDTMEEAILWEKKIKAGSRARKIHYIELQNPTWRDLYAELF